MGLTQSRPPDNHVNLWREHKQREADRIADLHWESRKSQIRKEIEDAKTLFRGWKTREAWVSNCQFYLSFPCDHHQRSHDGKIDRYPVPWGFTVQIGIEKIDEKTRAGRRFFTHNSGYTVFYDPKPITYDVGLTVMNYFTEDERRAMQYVLKPYLEVPPKTEHQLLMEKLEEISLGLKHIVAANDKKELAAELEGILAALPAVPPKS